VQPSPSSRAKSKGASREPPEDRHLHDLHDKAEEAVEFYTSVFENSRILATMRYAKDGPGAEGSLMSASFELEGQEFRALNGGPLV
jgi:predicted 3-demethylubiquinone-9 3-methyltransferase (glyoxalase superfamily)